MQLGHDMRAAIGEWVAGLDWPGSTTLSPLISMPLFLGGGTT